MSRKTFKKRTTEQRIVFLKNKSSATSDRIEEDLARILRIDQKIKELEEKIRLKVEEAKKKKEIELKIQGYKGKIKQLREGKEDVI